MTVASGTGDNCHAYWLLSEPAPTHLLEAANRHVAEVIGSDIASTDAPRILRPPSLNHKHNPSTEFRLLICNPGLRYSLSDFGDFSDRRPHSPTRPPASDDPLLNIDPTIYVERLTGTSVPRSGKIACPFHKDDTPSLQVYPDPDRGWYCYGCRRGGSIYDFAAALWKIQTRGAEFLELRERLHEAKSP